MTAALEGLAADLGAPRTVNAFTDPLARCECVADHNPNVITFHQHHVWPLGMGGPDEASNLVLLCPTVHASIHHLLREFVRADGEPGWLITRHFGNYPRRLAAQGYYAWKGSTT